MTADAPVVSTDVVVLGAGPAGLATAWHAARRGLAVVVVDRAPHVGGLAASFEVDGQRVDLGSHRLHPSIRPDLLAELRGPLGVELQWRPRHGRVRLDGRWVAFPLRPGDIVRNTSFGFAARVLRDIALAPLRNRRRHGDASFATEVRRRLGPTIATTFYEPYAAKLWATNGDQLSAELARRRVGARSTVAIAVATLRRRRPGFWYPTAGFGAIVDALGGGVASAGGQVLTGVEITEVRCDAAGVRVALRDGRRIAARTVVSTIPDLDLARLAGAPVDVVASASALESRGAVLVFLTVARPSYTPFDAYYFPDSSTIASRLSEPKNYRSSAHDPSDRTVLCAEIPAAIGDDVWTATDDSLAERLAAELRALGLPDLAPCGRRVVRCANVYPVYRKGFEAQRARLDAHFATLPNVARLGRQALFAHDNTHHALLMGATVVEALRPDGTLDRPTWTRLSATFADHVVED